MTKRIISAMMMAILLIPILIAGGNIFAIAIGMISVLALKELIDLKVSHEKIPDFVFLLGIIDILLLTFSEFDGYSIAFGLSYRGIAITILTMFIPCLFYKKNYEMKDAMFLSGSILFLGVVFNGMILIRLLDIWHFIYLLLIVILTDTFAYIFGKFIGKHKCKKTSDISPNKTWEGYIGGTIMGTSIATIFYRNVISNNDLLKIIFITLLLSIIGQLGDLIFSKIKRENKIKDFSNLIPGHGGVLDRIDSLTFVILAYIILFSVI